MTQTAIVKAIVDTGADVSLVPSSIKTSLDPELIMKMNKVMSFNGNTFETPSYFLKVKLGDMEFEPKFLISIEGEYGSIGGDIQQKTVLLSDGENKSIKLWKT